MWLNVNFLLFLRIQEVTKIIIIPFYVYYVMIFSNAIFTSDLDKYDILNLFF